MGTKTATSSLPLLLVFCLLLTMSNCLEDSNEYAMMSSETDRRVLLDGILGSFISYLVMDKNRVPCSEKGTSYYNCSPNGTANPYERGCQRITGCARY